MSLEHLVVAKSANTAGKPAAEPMEPKPEAEGNADQQATLEHVRGVAKHKKRKKKKASRRPERRLMSNWSALNQPLAPSHVNQVLLFAEWCSLNRISERTGRRIIASGNGPKLTQLSSNRFGITVGNNATWQAQRERMTPAAPRRRGPGKPKERT
jgi:hypothetical protein